MKKNHSNIFPEDILENNFTKKYFHQIFYLKKRHKKYLNKKLI